MEKQYAILDANGHTVGSVWATSIYQTEQTDAFWFKHGDHVIATSWYGYRDIATQVVVLPDSMKAKAAQ